MKLTTMGLVIAVLTAVLSSTSHASMTYITTKARYKAKEGKTAVITYKGKDMKIPVSRIEDPKAITGTDVTVILYPNEIGIAQ